MNYLPRIVEAELSLLLEANGAVLIKGPKACGKTETATRMATSKVFLGLDENANGKGTGSAAHEREVDRDAIAEHLLADER
ncbi:MAG: hypothetical protein OXC05_09410 [Halieaceae bacterium]|nr:hypothetical protein [Halieaceae bacterium]